MLTEKTLEQLLKEGQISQRTYDKVSIAKEYIERKYNFKSQQNAELKKFIDDISLTYNNQIIQKFKAEIYTQEMLKFRKMREKISIRDYESIAIIGRGAFGEVHVCKEKKTGNIVAIKKIKKDVLILKNQIIHIRNEQLFMSNVKSPWIVDLKASFQENDFLFLVMEYCPGGDLMSLLILKDTLSEKEAKFYMAELVLSIESIHKLDCIHRDIKPDNILIDKNGHIKLSDFGLAKISEKIFEKRQNNFQQYHHNKNYSCVGTAYYVAPEVLNKKGYNAEIDWWSAGIIFYEMLVGYAPFCSKDTSEVCYKVLNWKKYFEIPNKILLSKEAKDLIKKLINNPNKRLGKNGADEIKKHAFFKDLDWENIRNEKPPFIPEINSEFDTKYFETFEENEPFYPSPQKGKRKDIEYLGYTYRQSEDIMDSKNKYEEYLKILDDVKNKISLSNIENNNNNISNNDKKNKTKKINDNKKITNLKNVITTSNNTGKTFGKTKFYNSSYSKKFSSSSSYQSTYNNIQTERNDYDAKLNIIHLPKQKAKLTHNNLFYKLKDDSLTCLQNNGKNKINIVHTYKSSKKSIRFSPQQKSNLLLKVYGFSKAKPSLSKEKTRGKNSSWSKGKNTYKDKSYKKNNIVDNCSLLKQLLKKSISYNNMKKKINGNGENNKYNFEIIGNSSIYNTNTKIKNIAPQVPQTAKIATIYKYKK